DERLSGEAAGEHDSERDETQVLHGWTLLQKLLDLRVDEIIVGLVAAAAGRVSPQRGDRDELDAADELALVSSIADREIQIGLTRHVKHRHRDRSQRLFVIAVEARRVADVVPLPRPRLR